MNKAAIKNFAILARVQLIEAAKQRAYEYGITENGENKTGLDMVGGKLLTKTEKEQRNQLISEINRKGYTQVMEEAAYTWFNRFIALRYMEVNGFLPSKVRLFTDETGAFKPEILKEAMTVEIDGLDRAKVLDLLDKQNNEELYKYLLITQCNAMNQGLPYMFEKISNWTELLFPANLLRPDSVVGQMVSEIPEEDWQDAVQIIGWMYQYYNTELKDDTFALLKKNVKITKERIPAATQLFTPDWIVRYMVENSLGRLWYEGHPNFDKSQWKYYLDEAPQEPEVELQLKKIRADYASINPEDIKVIDPCMGSGHILVYAFDVLMQIYTSAGWSERDAAKSIIENNLFGLDIDDRAGQLAYFAVMMKARKHNRRILNGGIAPNVLAIQESGWMTDDFIAYVANGSADLKAALVILRNTFKEAKEYGSILNVPMLNFDALLERIDAIEKSDTENLFHIQYRDMTAELLAPLVKQAKIMAQKYDVVVTNPPYMGSSGMNARLSQYVKDHFPDTKADLFSCFIERGFQLANVQGFVSMITMESWMFLSSFEKMRQSIVNTHTIVNMVHMPYLGKGGTSLGINFGTAAVIFNKRYCRDYNSQFDYICYYETDENGVPFAFPTVNERYKAAKATNFSKIPGSPVAYWVSDTAICNFSLMHAFGEYYEPRQGLATGDDASFLRYWYEVNNELFAIGYRDKETLWTMNKKYVPFNKGGSFRKWYGNNEYVIKFDSRNYEKLSMQGNRLPSKQYYFHEGVTWSALTSALFSARYCDVGFVFAGKGPMCFANDSSKTLKMCALMNSKPFSYFYRILSATMDFNQGTMRCIPYSDTNLNVEECAHQCIALSKDDWDSYETSWDFKKHPLV